MRKIPTLFVRDPDNPRRVLPEVTPGCEWVLAGEGVATRKYDGTCVMLDNVGQWWARREVKPGKEPPDGFIELDHDPVTDKRVGWEPVEQTGWAKPITEALETVPLGGLEPGTYELCGPKVNRNPEGYERHILVRHADALVDEVLSGPLQRDSRLALGSSILEGQVEDVFVAVSDRVLRLGRAGWEGVVWHHPDGRMAKLKAKDFR